MTGGAQLTRTVGVACARSHSNRLAVASVELTHSDATLIGYTFACPDCRAVASVPASPGELGLLLEFGVRLAERELRPDESSPLVSDLRRAVSARAFSRDRDAALPPTVHRRKSIW